MRPKPISFNSNCPCTRSVLLHGMRSHALHAILLFTCASALQIVKLGFVGERSQCPGALDGFLSAISAVNADSRILPFARVVPIQRARNQSAAEAALQFIRDDRAAGIVGGCRPEHTRAISPLAHFFGVPHVAFAPMPPPHVSAGTRAGLDQGPDPTTNTIEVAPQAVEGVLLVRCGGSSQTKLTPASRTFHPLHAPPRTVSLPPSSHARMCA